MLDINDVIILDIEEKDILEGIKAAQKEFAEDNLLIDNLRDRNTFVLFDCRVRGYLGELGIKKILDKFGIKYTIEVSPQKYRSDIDLTIHSFNRDLLSEIKTSNMPDGWTSNGIDVFIRDCINKGDIKIFKWETDNSFKSINRDLYLQIYFREKTKERDAFTAKLSNDMPDLLTKTAEEIYEHFHFYELIENTFFVAWVDKESLIKRLLEDDEEDRYYTTGGKRQFWKCKIIESNSPHKFINYLTRECPKCGGKLLIKENKKEGTRFLGCVNYPDCKFTASLSFLKDEL